MAHWGKPSNNRGSSHVHCYLCVANAPVLTSNNKEEYVAFVDEIVHSFLPDRNENPELHYLVKLYQLPRHSRILDQVKEYTKNFLNPSKINFNDPSCYDFIEVKSVSKVLEEVNITKQEYENALKISDDNYYQLHFRQPTDSCFVNNYFDISLLAWEASIGIQPAFDYYKAVTYMCSYLSKQEDECSQAMKQAFKESQVRAAMGK